MILLMLVILGSFSPLHAQQSESLIQTFALKEAFGVSHPHQIIDFDLANNIDLKSAYMLGPDDVKVPYQVLHNGKIAIQTDLPANAERAWKLPNPFYFIP